MEHQEGQTYKTHLACPHEKCQSSDAASLYVKQDDNGDSFVDGYCFSCNKKISPEKVKEFYGEDFEGGQVEKVDEQEEYKDMDKLQYIQSLECRGWKTRKLKKDVNALYGVKTEFDENGRITKRYYPVYKEDEICGYKSRKLPKTFSKSWGVVKNNCQMFGQHLYPKGGKFLVITGGEEDALAMKQVFMENNPKFNTAVVSPVTGEPSVDKQIKENFDWVTSFETVVIMMDSDKSGQDAAEKAAKLLKPGQAKIAKLRLKDPCEYVKEGLDRELLDAFWKAERYTPAGVLGSSQTYDSLMERANWVKLPLPNFAKRLHEMMNGGFALGEIINIVAASSIGKTTVVNELLYHFVFNTDYKIGVIPLESDVGELMENLMSIHLNVKLANMDDEEKKEYYDTPEFKKAYDEVTKLSDGSDRFYVLDHQGDVADGELKDKIEYLVRGVGCKGIILDPLTLALSGQQNEGMDEFMSWLLRFVKREKIIHINVAHVRKSGSGARANSTGADIHEEDIKGSGSIFQVGMINILLMRDKENENPLIRNTIRVVVSKARRTGNTGPAGFWLYNNETSRLEEGFDPEGDYSQDEEDLGALGAYDQTDPDEIEGATSY